MPTALLTDRTVIRVTGPDAEHLLQNVVTADIGDLAPDSAKPSALLSPQGKILFDFLVSRVGDEGFRLDVRAEAADELIRRLMLYKLRAKASIARGDETVVAIWGDPAVSDRDPVLRDLRFSAVHVWRRYSGSAPETSDTEAWTALRLAEGVAEGGLDYEFGDAFPHDVLLDRNGGVGFRKGCFVGQEVVSRMQHRGTARRRVVIVRSGGVLPPSGTPVQAGGRSVGALGTVQGRSGVAILRIDKVADALRAGEPLEAAGVPLSVALPAWAKLEFPGPGDAAEAG